MSNTVRTSLRVEYLESGSVAYSIPTKTESVATTSQIIHQTVQIVGTTHELLSAGDATDDCLCVLRNNHTTAVIEVGVEVSSVFYPLFKVSPGETAKMPRVSAIASTYLKSSAASTPVLVGLYKIAA